MASTILGLDARTIRLCDAVLAFWTVLWLVVGCSTGYLIWQLTDLSRSMVESGQALQSAGAALRDLSAIPVVGDRTGRLGDEVLAAATGVVASGRRAGGSIRGLSVLIGLAIALAPTGPLVLGYLAVRSRWRRARRQILQAIREEADGPALRSYLAAGALAHLDYGQLRAVSKDPQGDLTAGRHAELAEAEIARLGLVRSVRPSR